MSDEIKLDSMENIKSYIAETIDSAVKEYGIDKIDVKHAQLPGTDEVNTKGMNETQAKNAKFKKFLGEVLVNSGNPFAKAYNVEGTDAAGGYLVPVEFQAEVTRLLDIYGLFRKYSTNLKMNSKTLTMPKLATQSSGAWVDENTAGTVGNDTYGVTTFTRHTYAKLTPVSNELLQDSGVDLISILAEVAANDFAKQEDTQGFVGTGSPITGISAVVGTNAVELSGTLAAALTYGKLLDCVYGIPAVTLPNAAWYMHPSVLSLILQLADANNLKFPFMGAFDSANPMILGYPVRTTSVLPSTATTTVGTKYIVFGDLKNAYLAERNGFGISTSQHATIGSDNMFAKALTGFRFDESIDIQIVNPSAFSILLSKTS